MNKKDSGFKIEIMGIPNNRYEYLKDTYNLDGCPIKEECSKSGRFQILTIDIELSRNKDIKAKELYLKDLAFDLEELLFNFELYKGVERNPAFEGDRFDCLNCKEENKKHCQLIKPFEYLELGRKKIALELKRIELNNSIERQAKIKKVLYDLLKFRAEVLKIYPDISEDKFLKYISNELNNRPERIKEIIKKYSLPESRSDLTKNYLAGLKALTFTEKDILKRLKKLDKYMKQNLYFEPSDPE